MPLGITFRDVRYTQYYGSTTVYRGTKFHGNSTAEVTVLYSTNLHFVNDRVSVEGHAVDT